ncbi:MAG TPA: hypothetical protein VKG05_04875 [Steroidobacteraceae bacterium]|nr:hypothetical protein [Steroidobacteraceae bacterium]
MNLTLGASSPVLAGEQLAASGKPTPIGEALSALTNGATLKRVTLLAEQPDATVVLVHADYSGAADSPPLAASKAPAKRITQEPIDVSWTEIEADAGPGGGQLTSVRLPAGALTYFNPLWQYTRIQAGLGADPRGAHLDLRV